MKSLHSPHNAQTSNTKTMVQGITNMERGRTTSTRTSNKRLNTPKNKQKSTPSVPNTQTSNINLHTKSKKIVLFDSKDERDLNDSCSSSNNSDIRTNGIHLSNGRMPCLSARSNRSSGGNSTSSNGTDSYHRPMRSSRSVSTPATPRSVQGGPKFASDGMSQRPLSRARISSRNSLSSEANLPSASRHSHRPSKRRDRLKYKCGSVDSLDSEDYYSPREPLVPQPISPQIIALTEQSKLAWDQFSTHVKLIDDSTDMIARRPRKTFNSSGIFQKAMEDLYGSPDYWKSRGVLKFQNRVGAIAKFATKFITGARRVKAIHHGKNEESDDDDLFLDYQPNKETVENAQRGWRILRQYVQEMAAEKRMSQSTLSWDMLRHTLKGISNMERARIDLYQRYGLLPMVKSDGTVIQENTMLSERARSAVISKPKPSITSARCSSSYSAKQQHCKTYAPIAGFSGTGLRLDFL